MGIFQRIFGRSALDVAEQPPIEVTAYGGILSKDPGVPLMTYRVGDIEALWKSQPNLRKVIDFTARNISTIPLHVFERKEDDSRVRVREGDLATLMKIPAPRMGSARFWRGVLTDGLLYDRWAVMVVQNNSGGFSLVHIPSWRLKIKTDALNQVESAKYMITDGTGSAEYEDLDLERTILWYGYSPTGAGSSMVFTLLDILADTAESVRYRRQIWKNGARSPQWLERPEAAPNWSKETRNKWLRGFRAAYSADGPNAGGVPLLEEGMKLHTSDSFSPKDVLDLEGRELTAVEVASAFHIAPELVGIRQGNYSNVDAYRQMLYRESLGPYIDDWVQAINAQLTPMLTGNQNLYVEPHLDAKLRGSFLEEAQMITTATGAPWMAVDEARPIRNMEKLGGAFAKPVQPLNLLYSGQMSALAGEQNRRSKSAPVRVKSDPADEAVDEVTEVLRDFFARQRDVVLSRLGAKSAAWWDSDRWDSELAADLYALAVDVTAQVGAATANEMGMPESDYDVDRTLQFLKSIAVTRARLINDTTLRQIEAALADDLDDDAEKSTPEGVFDEALDSRSALAGMTLATTLTTFAVTEMGKQSQRPGVTKTWVTTSGNPRPSHAIMDGETVPIHDAFSNGLEWPGDVSGAGGDAGEIANCSCATEILIP